MPSMIRPCFLVIDREFPGSISTRKLVIETAKFNVLTAYSGKEAFEIFQRFPAVNGVVLDGGIDDIPCNELARHIKAVRPELPLILIVGPGLVHCPSADYVLESFEPGKLLSILKELKPDESAEIEQRNEDLSRQRS